MEHTRDEHCTVDAETLCCTECGVYHEPAGCEGCGGHGFHRVDACPVLIAEIPCENCRTEAAGDCPRCFANTGTGCAHGRICDACTHDLTALA